MGSPTEQMVNQVMVSCRQSGPEMVVVNKTGAVKEYATAKYSRIKHDFVLVSGDGDSVGVKLPWLECARDIYPPGTWVALLKRDAQLGGYHRVW
jgi:hypothetical protein